MLVSRLVVALLTLVGLLALVALLAVVALLALPVAGFGGASALVVAGFLRHVWGSYWSVRTKGLWCCGLCCCGWLLLALRSRVGYRLCRRGYGRWPYRPGLGIRVDSYLNTKDTDMQRRGLGKLDHDLSVCLPTIVADERLKMFGKHLSVEFVLRRDLLVVRGAELQGVAVGDQDGPVPEILPRFLGLPLETCLDLLRRDPAGEDTGKAAFDAAFELALETVESVEDTHPAPFLRRVLYRVVTDCRVVTTRAGVS